MPSPDIDASRIISVLHAHGVHFVVIGGFALELWDVAVPPTIDVDITPEESVQNLARLAGALNELQASIRFGEESIEIPGGLSSEHLTSSTVLNLITTAGPVDVTMQPAGTDGFTDLSASSTEIAYADVMVPTAHLADVARSKEAAGRSKDLRVLPAIRAHIERLDR
jgi:hypothetical protein